MIVKGTLGKKEVEFFFHWTRAFSFSEVCLYTPAHIYY